MPHFIGRDGVFELFQRFVEYFTDVLACDIDSLIGWEIMSVVLQLIQIKRRDEPVGRVAGDYIQLPGLKGFIRKREVHFLWLLCKGETVSLYKARIAVRTRHKILAKTSLPIRCQRNGVGDGFQVVLSRDIAADENCKII